MHDLGEEIVSYMKKEFSKEFCLEIKSNNIDLPPIHRLTVDICCEKNDVSCINNKWVVYKGIQKAGYDKADEEKEKYSTDGLTKPLSYFLDDMRKGVNSVWFPVDGEIDFYCYDDFGKKIFQGSFPTNDAKLLDLVQSRQCIAKIFFSEDQDTTSGCDILAISIFKYNDNQVRIKCERYGTETHPFFDDMKITGALEYPLQVLYDKIKDVEQNGEDSSYSTNNLKYMPYFTFVVKSINGDFVFRAAANIKTTKPSLIDVIQAELSAFLN